jgi:tRNA (guanine37-N1)-methyltransferase
MIIKPEVIEQAIETALDQHGPAKIIFFSPQGELLNQPLLRSLASELSSSTTNAESTPLTNKHIILVCTRYEGIDARVQRKFADRVISVGDYVLLSGDSAGIVFLEGLIRLLDGVLGNQLSHQEESFESPFLDHDQFGLPHEWNNEEIPHVLKSGNHKKVDEWRKQNAVEKTINKRFDWIKKQIASPEDKKLVEKTIPPHYVALMHTDVKTKNSSSGVTSVTSIDLHDIARSCTTYGVKNFFVVTPLKDQQRIIKTFLGFWQSDEGKSYNHTRSTSTSKIIMAESYDEVIQAIEKIEGSAPISIATGAQQLENSNVIDYHSQGVVWETKKPVLIILGTGQGLTPERIKSSDHLLIPLNGLTSYNHLSVRSAAAIILDRWLGLNQVIAR